MKNFLILAYKKKTAENTRSSQTRRKRDDIFRNPHVSSESQACACISAVLLFFAENKD